MKVKTRFRVLSFFLELILNSLIVLLLSILIHLILWAFIGRVDGSEFTIRTLYILLFLSYFNADDIIEIEISEDDK